MNEQFERVYTFGDEIEFKAVTETKDDKPVSRTIIGYANVFNTNSRAFKAVDKLTGAEYKAFEMVDPTAFDTANFSETVFNVEHKNENIVGAVGRNLTIQKNNRGVFFKLELPLNEADATTAQNDLYKNVSMGLIRGTSFAAVLEGDRYEKNPDNTITRHITKVGQVFDLTATVMGVFPDGWVAKRSLNIDQPAEVIEVPADDKEAETKTVSIEIEIEKLKYL